jgi:inhibitor of cysteine peptidase
VYVNRPADITLKLKENPTTGYRWNLTVTPGLVITNDTFIPSDTTGKLVGSGGTRIWEMGAAGTGTQTIHAVYMRSWEPVTGNETAFSMTVIVQ